MFLRYIILLVTFITLQVSAQNKVKPVEELINRTDPAWPIVLDWIKHATNKVEVLPRDSVRATDVLYHVQVTTRSPMGAIVYQTGGLLIDHGWIRILASGSKRLNRSIDDWNEGKTFKQYGEHTPYYLVADDVLGGLFAINGGDLGDDVGKMYYLSPDNLAWAPMHYTYSDFLNFCFTGNLNKFYEGFRWVGWQANVDTLRGDRAYIFAPPLWTKQGVDIRNDTIKDIPVDELYDLITNQQKQKGIKPEK